MTLRFRTRFPITLAGALLFGLPAPRTAQAEEAAPAAPAEAAPSPARKLFTDARALMADGKYSEACPKLEESLRLEVGIGTQFNLADCWEHIGRTASAQALFLGAAASAKAAGQADREQVLRDRATALEPRLSKLVVDVVVSDPSLRIKRDDLPLEPEVWGRAVALDPGTYVIKARATGKKDWQKSVEIKPETKVATVEVPELEAAAPQAAEPAKPAPAPAPAPPPEDRSAPVNYRALAVAGVGVSGLILGTVMGLKYRGANSDAEDICPSNVNCSVSEIQEHDQLVEDAQTYRTWTYVGFGVGGAALIGAGALWIFQRPKSTKSATLRAVPAASPDGSFGATLLGTF